MMNKIKALSERVRFYKNGLTIEEKKFCRLHGINEQYPVAIIAIPDLQMALQIRRKIPDMNIIIKNPVFTDN